MLHSRRSSQSSTSNPDRNPTGPDILYISSPYPTTCDALDIMKTSNSEIHPAFTRRRFLEQLGAIGGSSLVMTAMSSWDLMAGSGGSAARAHRTAGQGAKVLVLGAGLSGLVVGYELGKLGYDYQMLEARDRVGGLSWTVRKGTEHTEIGGENAGVHVRRGQYVNVGPWRIPYTHTGVLNYCKELGVPLQVFLNEADASYFYYEGTRRRAAVEQARAAARGESRPDRPHQRAARQGDRSEASSICR